MGQAIDQARAERELSKQQLEESIDKLEARVRAELDWKARLRRDGVRYGVIALGAVATLVALLALRAKLRVTPEAEPEFEVGSLADIGAELRELRRQVERGGRPRGTQALWQSMAMKAVTAAGAAAGTMVAKTFMERFGESGDEDAERFEVGDR